jgi:hypothetical protein
MNQEQLEKAKKLFFILLSVDIVVNAIAGFNSFSTVEILRNVQSGTRSIDQALINSVDFWDKFSMLTILTLIGVGLGLVKWLNSCYRFAKEFIGATGFKNEKWTVVGWIIPVFNLFKPYQIINEIYKAGSQNYSRADDWKKENGSWLLLTWWIFWAVTHFFMWIFGKEMLKKSLRGDLTLLQLIGLYEIQAWLFAFSILVAALWFIVAGSLTQRFLNRSTKPSRNTVSVDDDHSYKTAYEEMSSGQFQTATWAKAFANAEGNQDKAKALYIKYRVEQLSALPVQQPQTVSAADSTELPDQHEVAGSVYSENKSAIAVIVLVGLAGFILLISQIKKPSTNLPEKSSEVSTTTTNHQLSASNSDQAQKERLSSKASIDSQQERSNSKVSIDFDCIETSLYNKSGYAISLSAKIKNNSDNYVESILANCSGYDKNKNKTFYEEQVLFTSKDLIALAPNNEAYFWNAPQYPKYPSSTFSIDCQVTKIKFSR